MAVDSLVRCVIDRIDSYTGKLIAWHFADTDVQRARQCLALCLSQRSYKPDIETLHYRNFHYSGLRPDVTTDSTAQ